MADAKMTFNQYISNPLGKNNAVMSAITRESIRKDYTTRFNNILLRENGNINYYKYKGTDNEYIIHIKIPSEPIKNFYYDVCIRFYTDAGVINNGRTLNDWYFQVFSNDPAFVYNHAWVFNQNGLFFNDLRSKMSKIALTKSPDIKNPTHDVAYVKSIYFAYIFMRQRGLFKPMLWKDAPQYNKADLLQNVMPADEKIALREEEERKRDHRKKIEIDSYTAKQLSHKKLSAAANDRLVVRNTTKSPTIRKTKAINSTKRSRISKKIK